MTHNPRLRYPDHRAECNWNTFPDFDEDGDAIEAWCNADKETLGNIRVMPRGHERPVPVTHNSPLGNREQVVAIIDAAGRRPMFEAVYERTPEDYFDEYAYKEPDIWQDVLNDLGIIL